MSKAVLVEAVAKSLGGTKSEANKAVDAVVDALAAIAASGTRISLPPLGTFTLKHKAARDGRNPQTGEAIRVQAKDVVVFKASAKKG